MLDGCAALPRHVCPPSTSRTVAGEVASVSFSALGVPRGGLCRSKNFLCSISLKTHRHPTSEMLRLFPVSRSLSQKLAELGLEPRSR